MSGNSNLHEQLEEELADFVHKPAALLLNFGYQGVVSIIDALVSRHDAIVYDAESHACIIDGVRLHQGKRFVFPHNDIENLDKQLARASASPTNRRRHPGHYRGHVRHVGQPGQAARNREAEGEIRLPHLRRRCSRLWHDGAHWSRTGRAFRPLRRA
jgi:hypothetical protein